MCSLAGGVVKERYDKLFKQLYRSFQSYILQSNIW